MPDQICLGFTNKEVQTSANPFQRGRFRGRGSQELSDGTSKPNGSILLECGTIQMSLGALPQGVRSRTSNTSGNLWDIFLLPAPFHPFMLYEAHWII